MTDSIDLKLRVEFIEKQACFSQFTDKEKTDLAELLSTVYFAPGQTIVVEGDPVDSIYLIVEGQVDVRISSVENGEIVSKSVATLAVGDAIGLNDTGFYSLSGKRTATVVAMTDVKLLWLKLSQFHGFALANHHVSEVMRINAREVLGEKPL